MTQRDDWSGGRGTFVEAGDRDLFVHHEKKATTDAAGAKPLKVTRESGFVAARSQPSCRAPQKSCDTRPGSAAWPLPQQRWFAMRCRKPEPSGCFHGRRQNTFAPARRPWEDPALRPRRRPAPGTVRELSWHRLCFGPGGAKLRASRGTVLSRRPPARAQHYSPRRPRRPRRSHKR